MDRPLVSIITPTWERHDLLAECIENVRGQDYPRIDHHVVSDGPDEELLAVVMSGRSQQTASGNPVNVHWNALGRHWSGIMPKFALGVAPILAGCLLARGEYLMVLCDDERMEPDHLSKLATLLDQGADFAYSMTRMWWAGTSPGQGWNIGTDPPEYGQITNFLFRASLLEKAMPIFDAPTWNDWHLVSRWMELGARWSFLPEVTLSHRADR